MAKDGQDPGRLVGGIYAANTIGAVAGALASSLLLVGWLGSQHAQQIMMAVSAAAGLLVLGSDVAGQPATMRVRRRSVVAIVAALVVAAVLTRGVPPVSPMLVAHGRFAATLLGQSARSSTSVRIAIVGRRVAAAERDPRYHNAGKIQASARRNMRLQRMLGHLTTLVPEHPGPCW